MERSDSILLRTVRKRPYHDYTAIDHEQEETEDRRRAPRASQDGMGPHNERSDCAESSETPMGSEACRSPAQDHIHMEGSLKGEEKSKPEATPSATLHRSGYILFLTLIYICLAIFSWVVTCYLSFRPITAKHYGAWIWNNDNDGYGWTSYKYLMSLYRKNQRWYHAARVIQSIVGVLTIPLTSAVCSSAAVIFIQKRHARGGLSMRQVITIADKGWTDIPTYIRTFPFFGTKGWKRYGSSFLLLAIFVNLLGLVISPLQEVFLSTRTIKTPTWPSEILFLLDIPDQWAYVNQEPDYTDSNLVVVLTRSALDAATNVQRQAQLWQGANVSCALTDKVDELPLSCDRGGVTFGNMSQLENPFLAQLPGGYSTGLIQQFVPRINSSAQYQNIPGDEFPKACDQVDGAFYVNYLNVTDLGHGYTMTWGLEACMPANVTKSPWNSTRDRQDFTEELYLNVTLIGYEFGIYSSTDANSLLYKITLDTTAGYFELPNYMNGGIAGPLLDKDPNDICGNSCETEGMGSDDIYDHGKEPKVKRAGQSIDDDASRPLETVVNKGPLLTIAMALFGEGSFIQAGQTHPQAYASDFDSTDQERLVDYSGACVGLAPLGFLLADDIGQNVVGNSVDYCITNIAGGVNGSDVGDEIAYWISNFNYDEERLANAFTAAAFLANQAWMESNVDTGHKSLTVTFDMGYDTQIPVISRWGLIFVSILLGLDILILLPLAAYATFTPRWTSTLDSFTMMMMGAAVADKVPLLIGRETDKVDVLDKIPGCVGDQSEESDIIGRLGLGAPRPLGSRKNKRFASYAGDKEPLSRAQEMKIHQRIYQEGRRNIQV